MTRRQALLLAAAQPWRLTEIPGLNFTHNTGAYGAKLLPETMGPGCAFLDYDGDGWLDILLINGMDWPGHQKQRSTLKLLRNNRNGTFTDVTRQAGLDIELYGMGVAVADFDNDGFPDLYITAVGQNRLLRNNGKGAFIDVTRQSGLGGRTGFSTSALWFDYNRDGHLDLFVCNYVRWSAELDVSCSLDGLHKSYCTPEAYRGASCWLFRNRGNGTFEDVTTSSGLFDPSSKSLGAAMLDVDNDGWPDLFVANDTQPNKLYRNNRDGTFTESAVRLGVAFSEDGRARAGMGVDVADFRRNGRPALAVTNFDSEMIGLYEPNATNGAYIDRAIPLGLGQPSRDRLGFGCLFADLDLDGYPDLIVANGHIDDSVRNLGRRISHAQPPQVFRNNAGTGFTDITATLGSSFAAPKIARGLAVGDFDRDGDLDVLITTNGGPAHLYRNDTPSGNQSIRFQLEGRKSNRDAIGAVVHVFDTSGRQTQMVRSGSSYLSSSPMALTFGLGPIAMIDRAVVYWPSGQVQEVTKLNAGKTYRWVEGESPRPQAQR